MIGRRQLPVHSPLTLGAVLAALGGNDPREALAAELGVGKHVEEARLMSSGTHALTLALLSAMARRPGVPCALPGYACYDLVTAAVGAGVPVRLYDLDPRTLAPQPDSLDRALRGGAAALVVVHLYGVPVPMDAMRRAADAAGAILIEDAAQGTGARWNGRPLGAWGDLGVLSFGRGKGETGGGGGALLVRESGLVPDSLRADILPWNPSRLAFAAKLAAQWAFGRDWLYSVPASIPMLRLGETIYHEPTPIRWMAPASGRVLRCTRPLAERETERRRAHAARLLRAATDAGMAVVTADEGSAGWLRFPVVPDRPIELDTKAERLGVSRGYPLPLADVPALAPLLSEVRRHSGASHLAKALVSLPTHGRLREADLVALEQWLLSHAR